MLKSINIMNWKGLDSLQLSFEEGVNFIVGPNGVGKSSVLDAICFALLGDIRTTAIYQSLTYKDLIRDPEKDLEITLRFCPQGKEECTIKRTHSSDTKRKGCILSSNGNILTRRWDDATAEILSMYDTDELFLSRVLLLSEGDTFAYSTQPPGKGLTKHIENILGINRMESLRHNLRNLSKVFRSTAKEWKLEIQELKEWTEDDKKRIKETTDQLKSLKREKETILEKIGSLDKQTGSMDSEKQLLDKSLSQAKSISTEWVSTFEDLPEEYDYLDAAEAVKNSLDNERGGLSKERDSLRDEISWLVAQSESQLKIIELIEPLEEEHLEVVCPVCKTPLTTAMVKQIKDESHNLLSNLERRKEKKQAELPAIERQIQETERKLRIVHSIESRVRQALDREPKTLAVPLIESKLEELNKNQAVTRAEVENLKGQVAEKEKKILVVEKESAELHKKKGEQEKQNIMNSLVSSTKGQFVTDLFLDSLESALGEQRNVLLDPLTEELSKMWSAFLGKEVGVEMKDNAQIRIIDKLSERSLEFPVISGGEKTALLIFTQTLLCKYFSKADFMLLDEPLEHLDPRNRWALIKFLVDTAKVGYPKQLVVTTFEETLLREYLDDIEIRISVLAKEHE